MSFIFPLFYWSVCCIICLLLWQHCDMLHSHANKANLNWIERERERECVWEREREKECVCVRETESVCVCVCECEREREREERERVSVCERDRECVRETESVWERQRVCERDRECVRETESVWERERERETQVYLTETHITCQTESVSPTCLPLSACKPSLSVSSWTGMALGKSCLLARTNRSASLISSSASIAFSSSAAVQSGHDHCCPPQRSGPGHTHTTLNTVHESSWLELKC